MKSRQINPRLAGEREHKDIKKRFETLNKQRLARSYADMRQNQRQFIECLPVLFHVNHPILPGYVSKDTPAGIPNYSADTQSIIALRKYFRGFEFKKKAYRNFDIQAIYLMGSSGSIAYSKQSDFDIWLCHASSLDHIQVDELQVKARGIEQWASDLGIDANIYLVDPIKFKRGEIGTLSSESSGSALHYLLLEEFYRTSLLLAGRYPVWWLIPADKEEQYEEIVESFQSKRFIHSNEHIDFGGLNFIPAEEFYGATLWLLYKSINSPYKSILKILLMQSYASEYPCIEMIAQGYKRAVYDDDIDINKLDPYLMMLDKVEEYLIQENDLKRLDLIRRSFYFKVDIALSDETKGTANKKDWRVETLFNRIQAWGWPNGKLVLLDSRDEWNVNHVIEERAILIEEFTRGYQFLSDFARDTSIDSNLIKQSDLNVLGRKLYAAFERKAGKIDIIHQGITKDLYESHLSIHQFFGDDNTESWMIFSGIVDEKDIAARSPIKRTYDLMELITWCYFNKLLNKNTIIALYTDKSDLSEREILQIIQTMEKLYPDEHLQNASFHDFSHQSRISAVGTFINLGVDPFSEYTKKGQQITSNRTDALRFGGMWENLALSIEQVIITSWQEVLTFRYFGVKGLMNCLRDYLQWSPPSSGQRPPRINAHSYSSYRGPSIALRIENVFEQVISFFYTEPVKIAKQYILGIEWDYYLLQIEDDHLNVYAAGTIDKLIEHLASPRTVFHLTEFDIEADKDSDLPIIYSVNKASAVQCFYRTQEKIVDIYILDENGTLYHQQDEFYDSYSLVTHFQQFFSAIHKRMNYLCRDKHITRENVLFYKIEHSNYDGSYLEPYDLNHYIRPSKYTSLQVIGDKINGEAIFTLYCEGREFTSLEYGKQLYYKVAEYILSKRKNSARYPIYITDLDLSKSLLGVDVKYLQTFHYLKYKKEIEQHLNIMVKTFTQ